MIHPSDANVWTRGCWDWPELGSVQHRCRHHAQSSCALQVPLGVVLCIPPFNYPVNLAVSKIGPALMAGNTVVIKPPTQGAVSGVHMIQVLPHGCMSTSMTTAGPRTVSQPRSCRWTWHDRQTCLSQMVSSEQPTFN
jgi:gamma-glutamyl phosphate reductase